MSGTTLWLSTVGSLGNSRLTGKWDEVTVNIDQAKGKIQYQFNSEYIDVYIGSIGSIGIPRYSSGWIQC